MLEFSVACLLVLSHFKTDKIAMNILFHPNKDFRLGFKNCSFVMTRPTQTGGADSKYFIEPLKSKKNFFLVKKTFPKVIILTLSLTFQIYV